MIDIQTQEDDEVSLIKLPSDTDFEKRREEAFNAVYAWRKKEFEGVSCSRKDLWVSLCHKAGYPPLNDCFDDFSLFAPLAKALVFCCITPTATLRKIRANGMQDLVNACEDWIDANVKISEESEIISLGLRVLNDSTANQSEAVPSGDSGKH
jgi:hypothetical protein